MGQSVNQRVHQKATANVKGQWLNGQCAAIVLVFYWYYLLTDISADATAEGGCENQEASVHQQMKDSFKPLPLFVKSMCPSVGICA